MSKWTLDKIAENLRDIDFAMLPTHTEAGEAARPMSNNRSDLKMMLSHHYERLK